jgi:hypothetical protein
MRSLNQKAINTLAELLEEKSTPAIRLKTAIAIIEFNKLSELPKAPLPYEKEYSEFIQMNAEFMAKMGKYTSIINAFEKVPPTLKDKALEMVTSGPKEESLSREK